MLCLYWHQMYLDLRSFTHPLPFTKNKALISYNVFVSKTVKYGKLHTFMSFSFLSCHLETYINYFLLMHNTVRARFRTDPCWHSQQRLQPDPQGCVKRDVPASVLGGKSCPQFPQKGLSENQLGKADHSEDWNNRNRMGLNSILFKVINSEANNGFWTSTVRALQQERDEEGNILGWLVHCREKKKKSSWSYGHERG